MSEHNSKLNSFTQARKLIYNPLGNLNSRRSPGERSSLEAAVPTSPRRNF